MPQRGSYRGNRPRPGHKQAVLSLSHCIWRLLERCNNSNGYRTSKLHLFLTAKLEDHADIIWSSVVRIGMTGMPGMRACQLYRITVTGATHVGLIYYADETVLHAGRA